MPLWRLVGSRQDPVDCMLALSCASLPSAGATRHICVASSHQVCVCWRWPGWESPDKVWLQQHHAVTLYDVGVTPLAFAKPLWVGSEHTVRCVVAMRCPSPLTPCVCVARTLSPPSRPKPTLSLWLPARTTAPYGSGMFEHPVASVRERTGGGGLGSYMLTLHAGAATLGERNGGHSKGISCVDLAGNVAGSARCALGCLVPVGPRNVLLTVAAPCYQFGWHCCVVGLAEFAGGVQGNAKHSVVVACM